MSGISRASTLFVGSSFLAISLAITTSAKATIGPASAHPVRNSIVLAQKTIDINHLHATSSVSDRKEAPVPPLGMAHSSTSQDQVPSSADTQSAPDNGQLADIIVTAQKRSQNLNDVGATITALDGDQLASKRITTVDALVQLVPSFTVTRSQFNIPSYTLRGVGFYSSSLSASPTVSTYTDEVPLPYPQMTRGAVFDLDRVEVLKGPQGTVFGQNSTGGLINFISARPTRALSAGANVSYSRFGQIDADAFISGPLTDSIAARVSARTTQGGAWQRSVTRNDTLGDTRFTQARLLLDADVSSMLKLTFNLNGWVDRSDTQAWQAIEVIPVFLPPSGASVGVPLIDPRPRNADWTPAFSVRGAEPLRNDNSFYQGSVRADLKLAPELTLTSITAYSKFDQDFSVDSDGLPALDLGIQQIGNIRSVSQELRLAANAFDSRLSLLVGANYTHDTISDNENFTWNPDGGFLGKSPLPTFFATIVRTNSRLSSRAVFTNAEFKVTSRLSLVAGVRYTDTRSRYDACNPGISGNGSIEFINAVQQFVLGVAPTAKAGECIQILNDKFTPQARLLTTGGLTASLNQNNVAWKIGVNFKPSGSGGLLYATVSRGYKAGGFPLVAAPFTTQLEPVTQESLTAYEAGFKLPLADRTLQLNGAAFYYAYNDKQLTGSFPSLLGVLNKLVNIPKSHVAGAELQINWRPLRSLTLGASGSYAGSRIDSNPDGTPFLAFPQRGSANGGVNVAVPVTGHPFQFAPKWSGSADADFNTVLTGTLDGFVGGTVTYQSTSQAGLETGDQSKPKNATPTVDYNDPATQLPAYTLLDLRAGIESNDKSWRLMIWGKNVTNAYYRINALQQHNSFTVLAGHPSTYGLTFGYRFR